MYIVSFFVSEALLCQHSQRFKVNYSKDHYDHGVPLSHCWSGSFSVIKIKRVYEGKKKEKELLLLFFVILKDFSSALTKGLGGCMGGIVVMQNSED